MSTNNMFAKRVEHLHKLGRNLSKVLKNEDIHQINAGQMSQWLHGDRIAMRGDYLRAVALSMLVAEFPFQTKARNSDILRLADWALLDLPEDTEPANQGEDGGYENFHNNRFEIKRHPGARSKVNIYFNEAYTELLRGWPLLARRLYELRHHLVGLYNDQATAIVFAATVLAPHCGDAVSLAIRLVKDPTGAKDISITMKACGLNASELGACFCEGETLQGRCTNDIDLEAISRERCRPTITDSVFKVDQPTLYEVVRKILVDEIDLSSLSFDDEENFWSSRWLWCVNGSHAGQLEKREQRWRVDCPKKVQRHRRVFSENCTDNPLESWSGVTYVSASKKLEHGKTRALFAGDTVTYFCFEHLLRAVERSWRGQRVVLDPGKDGQIGIWRRIRRLQARGGINLMLDYDDFNSQHSLESMSTVIRAVCDHCSYNENRTKLLTNSFFRTRVFCGGQDCGFARGTLMSGHRGTSFINSILNLAYLIIAGADLENNPSIHIGDDVYVSCTNRNSAINILERVRASSLRLNRAKQSVGIYCAELLRVAHSEHSSQGYPMRAISGMISGNWTNQIRLGEVEGLVSLVTSAWTIRNRCHGSEIALLATKALSRYTGLKIDSCRKLLLGTVGLNDGPVRSNGANFVDTINCSYQVGTGGEMIYGHDYATTQYLSFHASAVELLGFKLTGCNPYGQMLDSSYGKSNAEAGLRGKSVKITKSKTIRRWIRGGEDVLSVIEKHATKGAFAQYPLLHLIRNALSICDLTQLLESIGGCDVSEPTISAWGDTNKTVVVDGYIPYADACHLSARLNGDVLRSARPFYI